MYDTLDELIHAGHIDSFLKLRCLLLLQHPGLARTDQELAGQLSLGDMQLVNDLLVELQAAGILDQSGDRYMLRDEPSVRSCVQRLAEVFDDPLVRQEILARVDQSQEATDRHLEMAHAFPSFQPTIGYSMI